MSEQRCKRCGALKEEHYDGVRCPLQQGTYYRNQTFTAAQPEEGDTRCGHESVNEGNLGDEGYVVECRKCGEDLSSTRKPEPSAPAELVIPDQTLATNMRKTLESLCDVVDGWQKKCKEKDERIASLETALAEEREKKRELQRRLGKPRCIECNFGGLSNCAHFDECGGRFVYALEDQLSTANAQRETAEIELKQEFWRQLYEAGKAELNAEVAEGEDVAYTIHDIHCCSANAVFRIASRIAKDLPPQPRAALKGEK